MIYGLFNYEHWLIVFVNTDGTVGGTHDIRTATTAVKIHTLAGGKENIAAGDIQSRVYDDVGNAQLARAGVTGFEQEQIVKVVVAVENATLTALAMTLS